MSERIRRCSRIIHERHGEYRSLQNTFSFLCRLAERTLIVLVLTLRGCGSTHTRTPQHPLRPKHPAGAAVAGGSLVGVGAPLTGKAEELFVAAPLCRLSGSAPPPPAGNPHPGLTPSTLHRAPVGQGPPGPGWLAISFGFWYGRALATGTACAGLCLIHYHRSPWYAGGRRPSTSH